MKFKYLMKTDFIKLKLNVNLDRLEDNVRYPVMQHMLHNDVEVRAVVQMSQRETDLATITMPIDFFLKLPEVNV